MGLETPLLQAAQIAAPAVSGALESRAQRAQSESVASAAERNAQLTRLQGALEANRRRRLGSIRLSQARAQMGASGLTISGSPLDLLSLQAADIERDGMAATIAARNTARLDLARAASARVAGGRRARASLLLGGVKAGGIAAGFLQRSK